MTNRSSCTKSFKNVLILVFLGLLLNNNIGGTLSFSSLLKQPRTLAANTKSVLSMQQDGDELAGGNVSQQRWLSTISSRRRQVLGTSVAAATAVGFFPAFFTSFLNKPQSAMAYDPDPDPLKESLYLISRVQEATCLQERYIDKKSPPIQKMKLTLRLVDRSYRLLDQINFVSKFVPADKIVVAAQVGNEASESLQDAIDFVYGYPANNKAGSAMTETEKAFLMEALASTREKLFDFLDCLKDEEAVKLGQARARVEEENKLNIDEFDPDLANDAGIYNPIILPWKNRT